MLSARSCRTKIFISAWYFLGRIAANRITAAKIPRKALIMSRRWRKPMLNNSRNDTDCWSSSCFPFRFLSNMVVYLSTPGFEYTPIDEVGINFAIFDIVFFGT